MENKIRELLYKIEKDRNVEILFACESGSRAWGFPSKDSDYDVRFIYKHERDWYFSIDEHRDVIELPVNKVLDISGWDIRKGLRLCRKSNAPLFEWIQSPIIYKKNDIFYEKIRMLAPEYFLPKAGFHHYFHMARNCFENDLKTNSIKIKKYFYALRPILACLWISDKHELPPMEFAILRRLVDDSLQSEIDKLLKLKELGDEQLYTPQIPQIHQFIETCLKYCESKYESLADKNNSGDKLNELFRSLFNN